MLFVRSVLGGLVLLTLTGCAGTYHSYIDNLQLAFAKAEDADLSLEEVINAPSDLLYVQHGERPVAAMALFKVEAGQHKWVSADKAMLIMQQGRLVRTLGFSNDLLYLTNTVSDPVQKHNTIRPDSSWLRLADWQSGEYGYALRSRFEVLPAQEVSFFQQKLTTTLVVEYVQYEDDANYLRFDNSWKNYFWFDTASGTLIRSEQTLAPFGAPITMTYISRIARLVSAGDQTTAQVYSDEK
ncbi:YjbF family lipoprotein [Rheinheimera sp.]|uniref:YjbF family lipoprotein n=1 Tax=Rheinheimera sp. TaxID=1869214 RepID=UPI002735B89B|nr:YjbF family lipoprotein [Rheinheimera sp.]MDP2715691.1 YjbF family lipoprotein [Rheinheimera sp.]